MVFSLRSANASLGYADAFRTGADILLFFDPDLDENICAGKLDPLRHGWMNGIWWWNDPDQMLIREPLTMRRSKVDRLQSGPEEVGCWEMSLIVFLKNDSCCSWIQSSQAKRSTSTPINPLTFLSGPTSSCFRAYDSR